MSKVDKYYELKDTNLKIEVSADQIISFKNRIFVHNMLSKRLEELILSQHESNWLMKLISPSPNSFDNNYCIKKLRSTNEGISFNGIFKMFKKSKAYDNYENCFTFDSKRDIVYQLKSYKIKKSKIVNPNESAESTMKEEKCQPEPQENGDDNQENDTFEQEYFETVKQDVSVHYIHKEGTQFIGKIKVVNFLRSIYYSKKLDESILKDVANSTIVSILPNNSNRYDLGI